MYPTDRQRRSVVHPADYANVHAEHFVPSRYPDTKHKVHKILNEKGDMKEMGECFRAIFVLDLLSQRRIAMGNGATISDHPQRTHHGWVTDDGKTDVAAAPGREERSGDPLRQSRPRPLSDADAVSRQPHGGQRAPAQRHALGQPGWQGRRR
jgi:hypothetical protein